MAEDIGIPEAGRSSEDIHDVGDFLTLIRYAEARGWFYCLKCKAKLTDIVKTVPNDGENHILPCPSCRVPLMFNAGWLTAKVLIEQQKERDGLSPQLFEGGQGHLEEVTQENGRKLIVAYPGPAEMRAIVPHGKA